MPPDAKIRPRHSSQPDRPSPLITLLRSLSLTLSLALLLTLLPTTPILAALQKPDCRALERWATSVDGKARWHPIAGNRSWLPQAFETAEFATLFGAPALQWSVDDTGAIGDHLSGCMQAASKAKRFTEQKALIAARNYIVANLKGVLVLAERLEARNAGATAASGSPAPTRARAKANEGDTTALQQALSELLALPDSPELLRALGMLHTVDFANPRSYGQTYGRIGLRPGRKLLQTLRNLDTDTRDPRVAPQLAARYQPLRDALITAQLDAIAQTSASLAGLKSLSGIAPALEETLATPLSAEERERLGQAIAARRLAIQQTIIERAKARIDQSPADPEGLQRVDTIVANTAKAIIDPRQLNGVRHYAGTRQQAIADQLLAQAVTRLESFPATLAGLQTLRKDHQALAQAVGRHPSQAAATRYTGAATERVSTIARQALPEFQRQLAGLTEDRAGLEKAQQQLTLAESLREIDPPTRAAYIAAASQRRDGIRAALTRQQAARRQQVIAAGGDPDLAGYTFVDSNQVSQLEFRDAKLVIYSALGMQFAGSYRVSQDEVIVEGPNGSMVLTKRGEQLVGMGLTFERQEE